MKTFSLLLSSAFLATALVGCVADTEATSPTEDPSANASDEQVGTPEDSKADAPSKSSSTKKLRVMTYNIQKGGTLGSKLGDIAKVIKAQQPDVVTLNEVDHLQVASGLHKEAEELAASTGLKEYYYGCTLGCGSTLPARYGIAILSRFPLKDRSKDFLPNRTDGKYDPNGSVEPRVLLCGTVEPPGAAAVRVCATHLSNGNTSDSATIRKLQAKSILSLLAPALQSTKGRLTLSGDLNEVPGGGVTSTLGAQLVDSWPQAGSGTGASIPSDAPTIRWDYIYHGKGIGKALSATVPNTTASDHRPVVVDLPL